MLIPAVDVAKHLYWITSRATGTAALIFASVGLCVGLLYKLVDDRERAIRLGALHEVLGLATIGCLLVHGFILLGDNFLKPSVADIVVPFAQPYHRGAIGIGDAAGYVMIVFALLYYLRNWIGNQRFRLLHHFTIVAWVGAVIHTFAAGTDNATAWYLIVTVPFLVAVPVCLIIRLTRSRPAGVSSSLRLSTPGPAG
jgi:sulfoxide reductase heme-binding subunit YedZ